MLVRAEQGDIQDPHPTKSCRNGFTTRCHSSAESCCSSRALEHHSSLKLPVGAPEFTALAMRERNFLHQTPGGDPIPNLCPILVLPVWTRWRGWQQLLLQWRAFSCESQAAGKPKRSKWLLGAPHRQWWTGPYWWWCSREICSQRKSAREPLKSRRVDGGTSIKQNNQRKLTILHFPVKHHGIGKHQLQGTSQDTRGYIPNRLLENFPSSLIQQLEICFVQIKLNPQYTSNLRDYKYCLATVLKY